MDRLCNGMSPLSVKRVLKSLSTEMDDYYHEAVLRIQQKVPQHRDIVLKLLTFLVHTRTQFTVHQLRQALAVEEELDSDTELSDLTVDVEAVVGMSEGLAIVGQKTEHSDGRVSVFLAHETISAFLKANHQVLPHGPDYIARLCLAYMAFPPCLKNLPAVLKNEFSVSEGTIDYQNRSEGNQGMPFFEWIFPELGYHIHQQSSAVTLAAFDSFLVSLEDSSHDLEVRPFRWFANKRFAFLLQRCIHLGADVKRRWYHGDREFEITLLVSIRRGDVEISRILLEQEFVDVNDGLVAFARTALHCAVEEEQVEEVKMLLQHKAIDVNLMSGEDGSPSPLVSAIVLGRDDLVEILLAHPTIDINLRADYTSPLEQSLKEVYRVKKGAKDEVSRLRILETVLARDDLDVHWLGPMTRVSWAVWAACRNYPYVNERTGYVVGLFLGRSDLEVNQRDSNGRTVLDHAKLLLAELESEEQRDWGPWLIRRVDGEGNIVNVIGNSISAMRDVIAVLMAAGCQQSGLESLKRYPPPWLGDLQTIRRHSLSKDPSKVEILDWSLD